MNKILIAVLLTVTVAAVGCGPSKEELAKKEAARKADSTRKADSLAAIEKKKQEEEEAKKPKSIVETAMKAGKFNTLVAALKATGLDTVLAGKGPFTVFAPTDEAFAKIQKDVDALMKDPKKLAEVLKYHVVPAQAMAADVAKMPKAKTVEGKDITLVAKDGKVMVNSANVVMADVVCTNGVIHAIDAVLMPGKK